MAMQQFIKGSLRPTAHLAEEPRHAAVKDLDEDRITSGIRTLAQLSAIGTKRKKLLLDRIRTDGREMI